MKYIKRAVIYILMLVHYLKSTFANKGKVVYMLNTPWHGNIGDQAIAQAQYEFVMNNFSDMITYIEIPHLFVNFYLKHFKFLSSENSIICLHGGGNFGTLWRGEQENNEKIIAHFQKRRVLVFPQSAYINEDCKHQFEDNLRRLIHADNKITFYAREQQTYEYISSLNIFESVELVPDIVLSYSYRSDYVPVRDVLLVMRKDHESIIAQGENDHIVTVLNESKADYRVSDTMIDKTIMRNRTKYLLEKLQEFSESKVIITDRLHGMIFAYLTSRPCIAFDNLSKKSSNVYKLWLHKFTYIDFVSDYHDADMILRKYIETDLSHINMEKASVFNSMQPKFSKISDSISRELSI